MSCPEEITPVIPLTAAMQRRARQFAAQQPEASKARQVYLNTVAIAAVANFLKIVGIVSHPEQSDSWNPAVQFATEGCDLMLENLGRLECRVIEASPEPPTAIAIPPEVERDRLGYVVVKIDFFTDEAELLGFVPHLSHNPLPLAQLQPISTLIEYLTRLEAQSQINLSAWLNGQITSGWDALAAVAAQLQTPQLAWRLQSDSVRRAKPLEFASGMRIALVAGIHTVSDRHKAITVEIYSMGENPYLPPQLQLTLLDEEGNTLMEAQARVENQNIQFEFKGEVGDRFIVQIEFDTFFHQEQFCI
ncbi:DUF1822 family protein [Spirulina major CS-329]|nr:DUF1822 family protein [Spirulina subsalsa]MDB9496829.1 DUF1822 family protein [Spirulina subsalsa CS-330]MDB9504992.1 DUF1822 family protein [Spirulina major CS-329]